MPIVDRPKYKVTTPGKSLGGTARNYLLSAVVPELAEFKQLRYFKESSNLDRFYSITRLANTLSKWIGLRLPISAMYSMAKSIRTADVVLRERKISALTKRYVNLTLTGPMLGRLQSMLTGPMRGRAANVARRHFNLALMRVPAVRTLITWKMPVHMEHRYSGSFNVRDIVPQLRK